MQAHRINRRGNMLVETAIVLVVIALLTVIAIPVYKGRGGEKARLAAVQSEIRKLAEAQAAVAAKHGFYVPLQMLDDQPAREGLRSPRTDDVGNEPAGLLLIDAKVPAADQAGKQTAIGASDPRAAELKSSWAGPFAESKRVHLGAGASAASLSEISAETIRRDYPLDPWGNPYRFYSPLGLIGSGAAGELEADAFSDGALSAIEDRFDSYAIVSYGPDGKSDAVSKGGDDVIYLFTEGAPQAN